MVASSLAPQRRGVGGPGLAHRGYDSLAALEQLAHCQTRGRKVSVCLKQEGMILGSCLCRLSEGKVQSDERADFLSLGRKNTWTL